MAISVGFYKYVNKWIKDEASERIKFRPFETNNNPYKADVFIVGAHPTPIVELDDEQMKTYANALVDREEFNTLFPNYMNTTSRDVKGAIRLSACLEKDGFTSVISYVNALTAQNLTSLKKMKKEDTASYERGFEIFKEVLEEIQPPILLLHGTYALEQFRKNFLDYFVEFGSATRTLTELVGEGIFGKIIHKDGRETIVLASKSLATFKENDENYQQLLNQLKMQK